MHTYAVHNILCVFVECVHIQCVCMYMYVSWNLIAKN